MIFYLILGYVALFFFYAILKSLDDFLDKLIFCIVCATFFTMLIAGFIILKLDFTILSFMMGMSATGISYMISDKLKNKWYGNLFIVQLLMTIIGLIIISIKNGNI